MQLQWRNACYMLCGWEGQPGGPGEARNKYFYFTLKGQLACQWVSLDLHQLLPPQPFPTLPAPSRPWTATFPAQVGCPEAVCAGPPATSIRTTKHTTEVCHLSALSTGKLAIFKQKHINVLPLKSMGSLSLTSEITELWTQDSSLKELLCP